MKQTTKQIITSTFLVTAACLVSTNAFAQDENSAIVNATNLNIREQPTTQSKVVGKVKQGTTVQILGKEKAWAKISYDGKEGYVSLQFLKMKVSEPTVEAKQQLTINSEQKEIGVVTATHLNVRNSPALGNSIIGHVTKNEKVKVLGKANGWAKIEYKGNEGYISLEFLKFGEVVQNITAPQNDKSTIIHNDTQENGTIT
ncbi:TPA: SH3 domain-containing protein, partial [Bacillus pseudomycoides]|nr:SH3 domain-containing protein [Bacillus pseudomycoides]